MTKKVKLWVITDSVSQPKARTKPSDEVNLDWIKEKMGSEMIYRNGLYYVEIEESDAKPYYVDVMDYRTGSLTEHKFQSKKEMEEFLETLGLSAKELKADASDVCPVCSQQNTREGDFCSSCGHRFEKEVENEPKPSGFSKFTSKLKKGAKKAWKKGKAHAKRTYEEMKSGEVIRKFGLDPHFDPQDVKDEIHDIKGKLKEIEHKKEKLNKQSGMSELSSLSSANQSEIEEIQRQLVDLRTKINRINAGEISGNISLLESQQQYLEKRLNNLLPKKINLKKQINVGLKAYEAEQEYLERRLQNLEKFLRRLSDSKSRRYKQVPESSALVIVVDKENADIIWDGKLYSIYGDGATEGLRGQYYDLRISEQFETYDELQEHLALGNQNIEELESFDLQAVIEQAIPPEIQETYYIYVPSFDDSIDHINNFVFDKRVIASAKSSFTKTGFMSFIQSKSDGFTRLRYEHPKEINDFVLDNIVYVRFDPKEQDYYRYRLNLLMVNNSFVVDWRSKEKEGNFQENSFFCTKCNRITAHPRNHAEEHFLADIFEQKQRSAVEWIEKIKHEAEMVRCKGKTRKGYRCKRRGHFESGFCPQHDPNREIVVKRTKERVRRTLPAGKYSKEKMLDIILEVIEQNEEYAEPFGGYFPDLVNTICNIGIDPDITTEENYWNLVEEVQAQGENLHVMARAYDYSLKRIRQNGYRKIKHFVERNIYYYRPQNFDLRFNWRQVPLTIRSNRVIINQNRRDKPTEEIKVRCFYCKYCNSIVSKPREHAEDHLIEQEYFLELFEYRDSIEIVAYLREFRNKYLILEDDLNKIIYRIRHNEELLSKLSEKQAFPYATPLLKMNILVLGRNWEKGYFNVKGKNIGSIYKYAENTKVNPYFLYKRK